MQQTNRSRHRHITSFQVISLGFLSVILLGSLLLMLPIATKSGQCTSFLDALFTATSAVCVTGLVVNDTATYWSLFGQGVILLLIQIGGMGIITIAIAIAVVSGRKIGLMQRSTMQEAISAPTVGGIVRRTQFIIRTTILIEIIGAVLLAPADHIFDYIELDEEHAIFEISIPGEWIGKTIGQLDIRKKYNINIMALKTNDIMNLKISSDTQLLKGSTMLVLGETKHIQKCFHI